MCRASVILFSSRCEERCPEKDHHLVEMLDAIILFVVEALPVVLGVVAGYLRLTTTLRWK